MDFGTNSLWGSFSSEQAASAENSRIEDNESDTEASNSNAASQEKWDINEYLGVHPLLLIWTIIHIDQVTLFLLLKT